MAYPDTFYFATTKTAYAVGETVSLNTSSSWVHDYDGYSNLNYIDWWIYDYNTASWYDLSDTYSFSPYAGDYNWATFDVSIGNLGAGDYVLWGRAYDDQYNYSSTYTQGFSVYGGSNLSVYSSSNTTDGDGGNGSDVDLTGYNFNVVYESAYADNLISVDFVIENKGSDYADDFYVDFYLSKDDYIDENDEYLGSYYVSGVYDNDNTGTLTKTLALSSISDSFWTGSGTYYIGMEINSDGYLAETDELNNSNVGFAYDYDDIYIYV